MKITESEATALYRWCNEFAAKVAREGEIRVTNWDDDVIQINDILFDIDGGMPE